MMIKPRIRLLYLVILKEVSSACPNTTALVLNLGRQFGIDFDCCCTQANIVITVLTSFSILYLRSAHSLWFGLGAIIATAAGLQITQSHKIEIEQKAHGMIILFEQQRKYLKDVSNNPGRQNRRRSRLGCHQHIHHPSRSMGSIFC